MGGPKFLKYFFSIANTDKNILEESYQFVKLFRISRSGSTELLKTSNLTLKRKQFSTPKEGNPGNFISDELTAITYTVWTVLQAVRFNDNGPGHLKTNQG